MLETIQLPACISDLNPGLTDMDRDALPHCRCATDAFQKPLVEGRGRGQNRTEQIWAIRHQKLQNWGSKKRLLDQNSNKKAKSEWNREIFEESVCKDASAKCKNKRNEEQWLWRLVLWSLYPPLSLSLVPHRASRSPRISSLFFLAG